MLCTDVLTFNPCVSQHFETDTQDLAGLEWSPNGCVLAVWDSCLEVRVFLQDGGPRLGSRRCGGDCPAFYRMHKEHPSGTPRGFVSNYFKSASSDITSGRVHLDV